MKKILIVEDDPLIREALNDVLAAKDYEMLLAEDGQAGLDMALKHHPDLILSDYFMPMKSGLEMVDELRNDAWGKTATVVFLTNNADTVVANVAKQSGVEDYLIKSDMSSDAIIRLVEAKLSAA